MHVRQDIASFVEEEEEKKRIIMKNLPVGLNRRTMDVLLCLGANMSLKWISVK
jgi:hypothetical protein